MCIRHIQPFPSPHCQSQFAPLQLTHPPRHVVLKGIDFCPGYDVSNYLTCPRGLEEVVWEIRPMKQACCDCEKELGEGIARLSL
ncbi:hypothetical protein EAE96_002909 [Botrytis aclada]|nr:hypothetical protein EAE96_002909 [Botrytis aclada]